MKVKTKQRACEYSIMGLSYKEASVLCALLSNVAGQGKGRETISSIYDKLIEAGVSDDYDEDYVKFNGSIEIEDINE